MPRPGDRRAARGERRVSARKGRRRESLAAQLLRDLEEADAGHRWPSARWRSDPVAFAREVILPGEPKGRGQLTAEQEAILRDLSEPGAQVAVTSGHKTGKDFVGAIAALWWFSSWDDARVRMTAVTGQQIRDICWREVRALHTWSQRGPFPIEGEPKDLPSSGLVVGLREIKGFTSERPEAVAGISSPHVLYIVTEASGVEDYVFEALKGNLAGGDCRLLLLSQPTRNLGQFYRAFHEEASIWKRHQLRSDRTPNALSGRDVIPGLAGLDWLERRAQDWGAPARWREAQRGAPLPAEDLAASPIWRVRVLGEFCEGEGSVVIPATLVHEAELRWRQMATTRDRLVVGLDVAKQGGDENVGAARRGQKILELEAWVNSALLPEEELAAEVARRAMVFTRKHRPPTSTEPKAIVIVDATGSFGIRVAGELQAYSLEIDVVAVNFGQHSPFRRKYRYLRDQLWFGAREWLAEGGALPPDTKLPAELAAPGYEHDLHGRLMVEPKDKLRRKLGRSTDRADAVLLAVYEPRSIRADAQPTAEAQVEEGPQFDPYAGLDATIDPYAGLDAWQR